MNPATSAQPATTGKRNGHTQTPPATTGPTLAISVAVPQGAEIDDATATRLLTLALVSSGHLSQSQAARSLQVSRYDLIEMMGEHSLPVVRLSDEESSAEQRHLRELQALRGTPKTSPRAVHP